MRLCDIDFTQHINPNVTNNLLETWRGVPDLMILTINQDNYFFFKLFLSVMTNSYIAI